MKFRRTILSVSIAAAVATLSACGGGGGGGGGGGSQAIVDRYVPYHTPVRVGSVNPINSPQFEYDHTALHVENLSGNGQELIVTGRMAPDNGSYYSYNISIFGWQNGTLVDKTNQWFSGTDNRVIGTEGQVKFGDFNGDGKKDMYAPPYTDTTIYGPGVVFMNNGSSFSRIDLNFGNIMSHDAAVYDLNRDGRSDIVTMSFGNDVRFSFGNANGTFTTYTNTTSVGGGSGVAVADFMGDGTSTLIVSDSYGANRLLGWGINNGDLALNQISVLPTPRFLLPKWSSFNFSGSHDVRVLAFDFDSSGRTSAVIFSRPWITNGVWPEYSEVQFLKNQGSGVFIDVTDNVLVGYNHNTDVSYNPKLMDVNSDGLIDIVLSSPNWDNNSGSTVLIHTKEHKYVASYATVLKAFQDQAQQLESQINQAFTGANGIVFVQGPDGAMYLATAVSYVQNGTHQKAIYLSKLGATTATAQATVDAIKQQWPWMNSAQVNQVLAQSSTTWFGLNVLDPSRVLLPVGELRIPGATRTMSINGSIGGIQLNGVANQIKVLDSVGRDFNINMSSTAVPMMNLFARSVDAIDDDTRGAQFSGMNMYRFNGFKFGATEDNRFMAFGITGIDIGKNFSVSAQYTRLPFSPYVQLNGSWGLVKSSDTVETTLNYRRNGWTAKAGLMQSGTTIEPGLVTRVNAIISTWAEAGYEWSNFRVYGGQLPQVINGSANLTLPTGIDNQGRIQYTNTTANVIGTPVHYARFSYNDRINRHVTYRINGIVTTTNQHSVIGELKFNF